MADGQNVENKPTTRTEYEDVSSQIFTLSPLDNTGNGLAIEREVTMTFQKKIRQTEGKPDNVSGSWLATTTRTVDGVQETVEGRAAKPRKALETLLKRVSSVVSLDDYEEWDYDTDFFRQSIKAPEKPAFDLNAVVAFEGEEVSIGDMRSVVEQELNATREGEVATQQHVIRTADALFTVHKALGGNIKNTEKWAQSGESGNMPLLTQLGKGQNAIRELMDFARLNERERAVLIDSTKSGKGLNRFRMEALRVVLDGLDGAGTVGRFASENGYKEDDIFGVDPRALYNDDKRVFTPEAGAAFLKELASSAALFDVTDAHGMDLDAVCDAVDRAASERAARFIGEGGKHFSAYNDSEYAAARRVFGMVHIAGNEQDEWGLSASNGFRKAADALRNLQMALDSKNDKDIEKAIKRIDDVKQTPVLAMAMKMLRSLIVERADERKVNELKQQAEADEGDDGIIRKDGRKKFADLDTAGAAAKLYSLLTQRFGKDEDGKPTKGDAHEVVKMVKDMLG